MQDSPFLPQQWSVLTAAKPRTDARAEFNWLVKYAPYGQI